MKPYGLAPTDFPSLPFHACLSPSISYWNTTPFSGHSYLLKLCDRLGWKRQNLELSLVFPLLQILYSLGHLKTSHSNKFLSLTDQLANIKLNLVHLLFLFHSCFSLAHVTWGWYQFGCGLVGCYDNTETVSPFTLPMPQMLMGSM